MSVVAGSARLAGSTQERQDTGLDVDTARAPAGLRSFRVVVWNDPVNLMSYVSWVFRAYFGHSKERAHQLMLRVHHDGRAVVSTGSREIAERDVDAMHHYGLQATLEEME